MFPNKMSGSEQGEGDKKSEMLARFAKKSGRKGKKHARKMSKRA